MVSGKAFLIQDNVVYKNNKAAGNGGAIYINSALFEDLDGVGIYFDDVSGNNGINTSYIHAWNNVEMSYNEAQAGGGLYLFYTRYYEHNVLMNNLFVVGNKGGGIYSEDSYLTIDNSVVAQNDGSGIVVDQPFSLF